MKGRTLKRELKALDITQVGFARYIGMNPRTVRSWIEGRDPIPEFIPKLLEMINRVGFVEPGAKK